MLGCTVLWLNTFPVCQQSGLPDVAKLGEKPIKSVAQGVTKPEKEKKPVRGMDDGDKGHGVSSLTSEDCG